MKKDLTGLDEPLDSRHSISKILPSERVASRVGWSESSKAITRDGDDYLRLGDFLNLEDQELEW